MPARRVLALASRARSPNRALLRCGRAPGWRFPAWSTRSARAPAAPAPRRPPRPAARRNAGERRSPASCPIAPVLRVTPARPMRRNVAGGGLLERSMTLSTAKATSTATRAARRGSIGSAPAASIRRASIAFSRASASGPRPSSRARARAASPRADSVGSSFSPRPARPADRGQRMRHSCPAPVAPAPSAPSSSPLSASPRFARLTPPFYPPPRRGLPPGAPLT